MKVSWVPVHSGLSRFFPTDRPFSEIEAAFSLQLNLYRKNPTAVAGLAKSWGWSRNRVRTFLRNMGATIEYPAKTNRRQNQRGSLSGPKIGQMEGQIDVKNGTDKGQILLIDFKVLDAEKGRSRTDRQQKRDRSQDTIKTNEHYENNNISLPAQSTEAHRLSELLFSLITEQYPKFKKQDLRKWAVHIDRAIRIDGRTPSELERVIRWCQNDPFWRSNILSTKKLREKFDQLAIKMNSYNKNNKYDGIDEWLRIKELQYEQER